METQKYRLLLRLQLHVARVWALHQVAPTANVLPQRRTPPSARNTLRCDKV
jgi:hypothetical protein